MMVKSFIYILFQNIFSLEVNFLNNRCPLCNKKLKRRENNLLFCPRCLTTGTKDQWRTLFIGNRKRKLITLT